MNPLLAALVAGKPVGSMGGDSPLVSRPAPIQKLRYSHEAMLDMLIAEPEISQNEIAFRFGMSPSWISTIICSDLFQTRLAARREQLIDPELRASMKLQFEGILARSLEILRHKLDKQPDDIPDQLAVQVAKMAGQSLGYGVKESRVSVHETHVHLEELGNNLVGLLRRRKQECVDGEVTSSQSGADSQSLRLGGDQSVAGA